MIDLTYNDEDQKWILALLSLVSDKGSASSRLLDDSKMEVNLATNNPDVWTTSLIVDVQVLEVEVVELIDQTIWYY